MYLKNDYQGYTFQPEYKQVFFNKWTINIGHDEIIRMRNNRVITDVELDISKFLLRFRFATAEMLFRYIGGNSTIEAITEMLDKLVRNRLLNKFMLSMDAGATQIPPDALVIYCLDVGGRTLLTHYSNEDTTNWFTTENMKGAEVITRDLVTTNFYIKLMQTSPDKVKHFKLNPVYRLGRMVTVPSFEMALESNGQLRYYIGEIARDDDFPTLFKERLERLDGIVSTQSWKKYFYGLDNPPPIFVYCEDDGNAMDIAKMVAGLTEITAIRYTTDARLLRGLDEVGTFLKYNDEEEKLQEIRASIFD